MNFDPERWQLEGASPELYERYLVPAMTLPWRSTSWNESEYGAATECSTSTPVPAQLSDREPAERERLIVLVAGDVGASLAPYLHGDGLAFPQEVHVALGTG